MTKVAILTLSLLILIGCEPNVASRGNIIDHDKISEIIVGTSTREEVATKLGTPTLISTFDDKIWYYIGSQTEQYSFFDPEVKSQEAIEVRFDEKGVVSSLKPLDLSGAGDITPIGRATPTNGSDDTFIRQLLGNLGHPVPHTGTSN